MIHNGIMSTIAGIVSHMIKR